MVRSSPDVPIHLWWLSTVAVDEPSLLARCNALLLPSERERLAAFLFERHRHEYLVTRALARGVLAYHLGVAPSSLTFRRTEYGRPELDEVSELRFNLTNTTEVVACAVAVGRDLGVDAEPLARGQDILELAETVFTEGERAALAELALPARRRRAVELWTLKESYIKARGVGLSLAPHRFAIMVHDEGVELDARAVDDDGARWELTTREVAGHVVALCASRLDGVGARVVSRVADLAALLT